MATAKKSRLGRGLDSLIAKGVGPAVPVESSMAEAQGGAEPSLANGYHEIAVDAIDPNPRQPRREMDAERVQELADSIRSEGLMQPIVVRQAGKRYELIAGERRWRAHQQLRLKSILARVVEVSDASSASMALIENLQRENLNPLEEAHGYASLMRDFDLTQEAVSERVGRKRSSVANVLRLLQLEPEIQALIGKQHLSAGHAKALLGLDAGKQRVELARRVIEKGLNVRETERLVASLRNGHAPERTKRPVPEAEQRATREVEKRLEKHLGTRVSLKHSAKKGRLVIEYYGNEDLERVLEAMGLRAG